MININKLQELTLYTDQELSAIFDTTTAQINTIDITDFTLEAKSEIEPNLLYKYEALRDLQMNISMEIQFRKDSQVN